MFKICNQVESKNIVCKISRLAVSYVFLKVSSKGEVLHGNVSVDKYCTPFSYVHLGRI